MRNFFAKAVRRLPMALCCIVLAACGGGDAEQEGAVPPQAFAVTVDVGFAGGSPHPQTSWLYKLSEDGKSWIEATLLSEGKTTLNLPVGSYGVTVRIEGSFITPTRTCVVAFMVTQDVSVSCVAYTSGVTGTVVPESAYGPVSLPSLSAG